MVVGKHCQLVGATAIWIIGISRLGTTSRPAAVWGISESRIPEHYRITQLAGCAAGRRNQAMCHLRDPHDAARAP